MKDLNDVEVRIMIRTDKVGSETENTIAFDKEEWDEMSEAQQDEVCREEMLQMIEWDYEVVGN